MGIPACEWAGTLFFFFFNLPQVRKEAHLSFLNNFPDVGHKTKGEGEA